jgi:hypothetical protein
MYEQLSARIDAGLDAENAALAAIAAQAQRDHLRAHFDACRRLGMKISKAHEEEHTATAQEALRRAFSWFSFPQFAGLELG